MNKTNQFYPEKFIKEIKSKKLKDKRNKISLDNSALLVIDMQKYFTSPSSHAYVKNSRKIFPNLMRIIRFFRKNKRPIFFTKHIDDTSDSNNSLLRWWKGKISKKSPLSCLDKRLRARISEIIIKSQYDAFHKTSLEKKLKKMNIKKVFITGLVSNLCCETTARSAFVRGFDVFFSADACASYKISHHISSLENLSFGFAVPFIWQDLKNI